VQQHRLESTYNRVHKCVCVCVRVSVPICRAQSWYGTTWQGAFQTRVRPALASLCSVAYYAEAQASLLHIAYHASAQSPVFQCY
jgi:hypothetical protein